MKKPTILYAEEIISTQFYSGKTKTEYEAIEAALPGAMKGILRPLLDAVYLQGHLDGIAFATWAHKQTN